MYQIEANNSTAQNLLKLRLDECLTQQELAFRAGIHQQTISYIETGRVTCSPVTAAKLAKYFGVPLSLFYSPQGGHN